MGGAQEEPRLGGKLPAGLFGFLRFQSRALSLVVGLSDNLRANIERPLSPPPLNPTLFVQAPVPPPPFQSQLRPPEPKSEGGRLGRILPITRPPTGAGAPAPTRSGGRYCVVVEPTLSAAGRGLPFKGVGGAAFNFQLSLSPPTPPQVRERRVPARARGGREWGGGVGSGLCPDTCLPRRPGPASVWREGGSPAPRPAQPPRIKGRLRRGETSGRPGGRGAGSLGPEQGRGRGAGAS